MWSRGLHGNGDCRDTATMDTDTVPRGCGDEEGCNTAGTVSYIAVLSQ